MHKLIIQFSFKAELHKFCENGKEATTKKLTQLHNLAAFNPLDATNILLKKHLAIASLIFLADKQDGTIKARNCAGDRKQQSFTIKDETTPPTINIANERQGVVILLEEN